MHGANEIRAVLIEISDVSTPLRKLIEYSHLDSIRIAVSAQNDNPETFRNDSGLTRGNNSRLRPGMNRHSVWLISAQCSCNQLELEPFKTTFNDVFWDNCAPYAIKWHTKVPSDDKSKMLKESDAVGSCCCPSFSSPDFSKICSKHSLPTKSAPNWTRTVVPKIQSTSKRASLWKK
uniref:Uncharacterized protein n=1 Tax=Romanomermis culicivorax TaxID=13658 RepID=A0A915HJQ1_ROMCU